MAIRIELKSRGWKTFRIRCSTFALLQCSRLQFKIVFMNSFWNTVFWGNTVKDIGIALGMLLVFLTILKLLRLLFFRKLVQLFRKTAITLDDFLIEVVGKAVMPWLYCLAVYASINFLRLSTRTDKVLQVAIMVVSTFFTVRIITIFISYLVNSFINKQENRDAKKQQAKGILLLVKLVVWALGLVFLIGNLGYNITTIVTGLGIGGVAIALAAQAVLGDLFSYLAIFFDKPFEIGDFIVVNQASGTVEYIGIKTTRIRALSGEQLVIANSDLTNSLIHNYKRMQQRRVLFSFSVSFSTTPEQLEQIPEIIKQTIQSLELTRFDRAHFLSFGAYALNFEVVYYVLSADYNKYMDLQQNINLQLFRQFMAKGIQFSFPTQIVAQQEPFKVNLAGKPLTQQSHVPDENQHQPMPGETTGTNR